MPGAGIYVNFSPIHARVTRSSRAGDAGESVVTPWIRTRSRTRFASHQSMCPLRSIIKLHHDCMAKNTFKGAQQPDKRASPSLYATVPRDRAGLEVGKHANQQWGEHAARRVKKRSAL